MSLVSNRIPTPLYPYTMYLVRNGAGPKVTRPGGEHLNVFRDRSERWGKRRPHPPHCQMQSHLPRINQVTVPDRATQTERRLEKGPTDFESVQIALYFLIHPARTDQLKHALKQ